MNSNFDKEFTNSWNHFLNTKNANDLHGLIQLIVDNFDDHFNIEPHEAIKILPYKDDSLAGKVDESSSSRVKQVLTSEEFLLAFNWPNEIFYFLNEELANLNRQMVKQDAHVDFDNDLFRKCLNLLKCVFVLSKNMICLNLIINTSIINQFLSSYSYLLNALHLNESMKSYFKFLCFLLIKAHDPYLNWFRTYYSFDKSYNSAQPIQINNQRQFSFKFDQAFFSFLFDSLKLIKDENLLTLAIHAYACLLNEIRVSNFNPSVSSNLAAMASATYQPPVNINLNENLLKAINSQIVEFLFELLTKSPAAADNTDDYMILNNKFFILGNHNTQSSSDANNFIKICYADRQLLVCRCIPLVINILHLSLPDKRLVDLAMVIERLIVALERVQRDFIKYELIRSYLIMLNECSDRAALKIVLVSKRFFICLLEQTRLICLTNTPTANTTDTRENESARPVSESHFFVHECIQVVLNLVKNLLENSQTVKDMFDECNCYELLYEILKETDVLDKEISMLINQMISEKSSTSTNKQIISSKMESFGYMDELENSQMAVLLIKLLPFMNQSAQEFSLKNICRLCTLNLKNQLKSCKNSILANLINLLNFHKKFSFKLIENIFQTIQILGKCSIRQNEIMALIGLLQPKNQFPYGVHILRCLIVWAKTSASIGFNLSLLSSTSLPTANENEKLLLNSSISSQNEYNIIDNTAKFRRNSTLTINQNALTNMMRTIGTGALSQNAPQQAKYFFDFQLSTSGIRAPTIKRWPGYAFSFHCWIKLRNDLETFEKKRRQLYSFYTDSGHGFEAFFTPDCSSLVVSVCTKKDFQSVQLRELDFDSSQQTGANTGVHFSNEPSSNNADLHTTNTNEYWHSIVIVHVPAKKPFGYSQVCIYIDGVLKKEADLRLPNFNEAFNHIRIGAAAHRPTSAAAPTSSVSNTLAAPFTNLKNVFGLAYKSGANEKSLSVTSIPAGSQDTVWDVSTCLMGQMSSCFVLHDVISDLQARLLYELGPNQYSINWLDLAEMSDLKAKFVFHYDAKCTRDLTCFDLSPNKFTAKFAGLILSCDNFRESLNSIGSVQIFYTLLNYLSSNQEYLDLVLNEWCNKSSLKSENSSDNVLKESSLTPISRKSFFDDSEIEQNVAAMILSLIRHLFHNNEIIQDRLERNNGVALLGFLLQRLPKQFIDIHLLRICQELVNETNHLNNKSLLSSIYEYLIFDFRIWNKADYEIRIGHIQFILTLIKDDKKYFRKRYGVQFFLDIVRTYFSANKSAVNVTQTNTLVDPNYLFAETGNTSSTAPIQQQNPAADDDDIRNLRSSFFGLIKYYAQKEIKINELNAILSFLATTTKNYTFQNDIIDMLLSLLEAPAGNDQLYLLMFEPNMADGLYSLIVQPDLNESISKKLFKLVRILLKTKKIYDKSKMRLKLDECGTYAGLINKLIAEYSSQQANSYMNACKFNENLVLELMENFLMDEATTLTNYDNLWHIVSLLNLTPVQLITDKEQLIRTRLRVCEQIVRLIFTNTSALKYMVKTAAWQDIICQLFCIEKKQLSKVEHKTNNDVPPIVVSTSRTLSQPDDDEDEDHRCRNLEDEWENLDYKEIGNNHADAVDKENSIMSLDNADEKNNTSEVMNQTVFNEKLASKVTSTLRKSLNEKKDNIGDDSNAANSFSTPDTQLVNSGIGGRVDLTETYETGRELLPDTYDKQSQRLKFRKDLESEFANETSGENAQEITELFEKVLFLIYKLLWEGVTGSNDDAWKERCQIFSSLHRLSKEFHFIRPIEVIESRLLQMSLKHCCSEAKKQTSGREQASIHENSRELIKLVDYFVSKSDKISEKLVSLTISLLDQIRVFDQKTSSLPSTSNNMQLLQAAQSLQSPSPLNGDSPSKLKKPANNNSKAASSNSPAVGSSQISTSLLSSYGIIYEEWAETSYLGMNMLINVLSSENIEICAQASAKINTILHNRSLNNCEEACYLISSVEKVMYERLKDGDEQHYAFLIPIMKCLIEKTHTLLQMNVQVPNIPFNNVSPTFYEDFKEYCKSDEWRIFIMKQVVPLKEQYLAMTINPCQMNMKIWWNTCYETLMVSIHKRNRLLGESKIKFEDTVFNSWKEREKQEMARYQNYLIQLKRNNLSMRKQMHTSLKFFTSERGSWNEGSREIYWMLSNHENRERMRCKLVENLKFDSHFEASRLRDYSGYSNYFQMEADSSSTTLNANEANKTSTPTDTNNLAQKLQLNKEAINTQINEDVVADEEFMPLLQQSNAQQSSQSNQPQSIQQQAAQLGQQQQQQLQSQTKPTGPSNVDSGISSTPLSRTSSVSSSVTLTTSMVSGSGSVKPQEYEAFSQLEEKEKLVLRTECELVTVTRVIKGRFELTNKYIYFFDTFSPFYYEHSLNDSNEMPANQTSTVNHTSSFTTANLNQYGGFSCQDFDILNDFKIPLTQLKEVQLRRYNLRRSALEFFLINEANFFINFNKAIRNKIYGKIMSMKLPNLQSFSSVRTQGDLLKTLDYTQKWCNHEMSNFEYLMKLNTIAGRTYNDLSQYPIFPWILKDYVSDQLDLNDPTIFRDLSKPVGVLNKKNEDYVRQKYDMFEDPTGTMRPFHYGTHYSNSANVMHYLVRLEPFTTLHIQLQSDRFDVADRQFYSFASTWRILYENPNDVKELIPEFFYLPEFLINMNNFDFGELQISKNKVNDVALPKWAKNPEHFIYLHRKALESDYVSEHLHEWIDLIFGYKQQGKEAEKALNVFMYYSYEGAIDLDAITDPVTRRATEDMISNFGQTPTQLLKEPHPKRKTREQAIRDKISQGKPVQLWHQIQHLKAYYVEFCDPKRDMDQTIDPIIYISIPRNHVKSFMQQGLSDPLISISQSGVIGVNGWQANDRSLTNLFSFEKDPSLLNEKTKKTLAGPFDPNCEIDHRNFVFTHDSKLLVSGGHWDNSLRVFSLTKFRTISQIYQHSNIVTCLVIDYTGSLIVTGSMDTTCIIWQVIQEYGVSVNVDPVPVHILYGHTNTVTSVDISNELDLVVSASLDGSVNLHTVRTGSYVKSLSFSNEKIAIFKNLMLKLSNERQLLVYVSGELFENNSQIANEQTKKMTHELFLYSINGNLISKEKLNHPLQDMIIKNGHCILALLVNSTNKSNANTSFSSSSSKLDSTDPHSRQNTSTASKIIFKENYDLKTIQTMRLKAPITCLFMTKDDGHLLVGLNDGKLIVITGDKTLK